MSNTQGIDICPNTNIAQNKGVALMPQEVTKKLEFQLEPQTGGGGMIINTGATVQEPNIPFQYNQILDKLTDLNKYVEEQRESKNEVVKIKEAKNITIGQALKEFITWKQGKFAPNTMSTYITLIKKFIKHIGGEDIKINDINANKINEYRVLLEKKHYSSNSVCSIMISVRWLFRYLFLNKKIDWDFQLIEIPNYESNHFTTVEPEETKAMINNINNKNKFIKLRNKTIISFLASSGVRVSELCDLKIGELKPKERYANIISKKNKILGMIGWDKETKELLDKYLEARKEKEKSDYVFISMDSRKKYTGKKLSTRSVQRIVKQYRPKDSTKVITPHSFRHGLAMLAVKAGVHARHIQKILRHENLSSSQVYMGMYDKDVLSAYELIEKTRDKILNLGRIPSQMPQLVQ